MPGTAVILGISALIPGGQLDAVPVILAATLGAIAGDGASFWLGHRYHEAILSRWPMNRHPEFVKRSDAFFHRHGGKSVLFARFTPGVRAFIPLVAGMLRMPVWRFYVANVASALVWALSHVLSGMVVGASLGFVGAAAERAAILLVVAIIVLWVIARLVRYGVRKAIPMLAAGQRRLWEWSASRDTWIARPVRAILDPSLPEGKALAIAGGILVAASWLFLGILEDVVNRDPLVRADVSVYRLLQGLRTPWVDSAMVAITEFGDTTVTLPVTIAVAVYLTVRRRWKTLAYWLAAVGGAAAINTAIKGALHRMRPGALGYFGWSEFSFPSGHSTTNAVMYGFLAFLVVRRLGPGWWPVAVLAWAGIVVPIAFSRLYLGAHWFSDVMGGLAFGMAWVAVLSIAYLHHQHRGRVRGLFVVACMTLVVAGGVNVYRKHAAEVQRYAAREAAPTVLAGDWWTGGWQRLPARRVDLIGEEEEPMTVQWAGPLEALEATLKDSGWREPEGWTMPNTLVWLTADTDPLNLPVLPYLESGRVPVLTLIHPAEARVSAAARWVVRLWATGFELRNGSTVPIWVGSVVEERFTHPYSLFTLGRMQSDLDGPRNALASALGEVRLVGPAPPVAKYEWDRRVLLAHAPSVWPSEAAP
ncbi:VTT domain-containing protein [Azospirillum palustre]